MKIIINDVIKNSKQIVSVKADLFGLTVYWFAIFSGIQLLPFNLKITVKSKLDTNVYWKIEKVRILAPSLTPA